MFRARDGGPAKASVFIITYPALKKRFCSFKGESEGNHPGPVQIYASTTPDEVFAPVAGAAVDLTIPAIIAIWDAFNGIATGLSIPAAAETRLLLVASATGGGIASTILGSLSAGLGIE